MYLIHGPQTDVVVKGGVVCIQWHLAITLFTLVDVWLQCFECRPVVICQFEVGYFRGFGCFWTNVGMCCEIPSFLFFVIFFSFNISYNVCYLDVYLVFKISFKTPVMYTTFIHLRYRLFP